MSVPALTEAVPDHPQIVGTQRAVLEAVQAGHHSCGEIAVRVGRSTGTASKALHVLLRRGLLAREGRSWSLAPGVPAGSANGLAKPAPVAPAPLGDHTALSRGEQVGLADLSALLAEPAPAESWEERALCAQTDPEIFFPEKGSPPRDAKVVCGECTVSEQCLDYALAHDEKFGIWGGLSEKERRRVKRERAR